MLVAEVLYVGNSGQIRANQLAQNACSSTVQDAYARHTDEDGVVDEIGDGVDGFVAAQTPDVDVLMEVQLAVVDDVTRIA